jgi:hypothetical protein
MASVLFLWATVTDPAFVSTNGHAWLGKCLGPGYRLLPQLRSGGMVLGHSVGRGSGCLLLR